MPLYELSREALTPLEPTTLAQHEFRERDDLQRLLKSSIGPIPIVQIRKRVFARSLQLSAAIDPRILRIVLPRPRLMNRWRKELDLSREPRQRLHLPCLDLVRTEHLAGHHRKHALHTSMGIAKISLGLLRQMGLAYFLGRHL
jgi:hypothetical protein